MKKEYAVIGLGRFGGSIVEELVSLDVDVLAIDIDEKKANKYQDVATRVVIGDTTNEQVLKDIGLRNFDRVIVAIGENIQSSILTTLLVKDLGVNKVIAKAQNDYHARVLAKIGADMVVHPERDMGKRVAHKLTSDTFIDYLEVTDNISIMEIEVDEYMVEKSLLDIDLKGNHGITVLAIYRDADVIPNPDPTIIVRKHDILIVIGTDKNISEFEKKHTK